MNFSNLSAKLRNNKSKTKKFNSFFRLRRNFIIFSLPPLSHEEEADTAYRDDSTKDGTPRNLLMEEPV